MRIDVTWLLLGLPLVFAAGWFASRLDLRQLRVDNRRTPKAYFRGLTHLLNEQQDQAIDAFIEAVQSDPDTSELHFALGGLFRRRGDYDRAVRVHEHLLARGDLSEADRHRAQHALALDFLKAGLLDRAEAALQRLEGTVYAVHAQLALLGIYERSRDWANASAIAARLDAQDGRDEQGSRSATELAGNGENSVSGERAPVTALVATGPNGTRQSHLAAGSFKTRLAHYACEEALALQQVGGRSPILMSAPAVTAPAGIDPAHADPALVHLRDARALAPRAPRPFLDLACWQEQHSQFQAALETLLQLAHTAPQGLPLAAAQLVRLAIQTGQTSAVRELLVAHYAASPCLDMMQALVLLDGDNASARDAYVRHLDHTPSLVAASRWMAHERLEHEQFHPQVQRALDKAVRPLERYRCAACGFEAEKHFWQCVGCQAWDSYPTRRVEEL